MLTADGCKGRRDRLWEAAGADLDLMVIADPSHLVYFANFYPSPFLFRSAEAGGLLVLGPERATLISDNVAEPFLDHAFADERIAASWYDGRKSAPDRKDLLVRTALDALARMPGRRVGVESAAVPVGLVEGLRGSRPGLELHDLRPAIRTLRRAKEPDEMTLLRRSIGAGEAGHAAALERVQPGMTEREVYLIIQRAAIEAADDRALVYGDIVSGPRCEQVGGPPTDRIIGHGELLLMDFSVVLTDYRGDFANTFTVGGDPTPERVRLYEACIGAMAAGEALLRPGTPAREIDAAIRAHFAGEGLDGYFTTHSGHGVGLGHPEPPYIVPESEDVLVVGDVVTLEPGLYVPGVAGMRYERNYLITAEGFETLTHHRLTLQP